MDFRNMTLSEIAQYIQDAQAAGTLDERTRQAIEDELGSRAWQIGGILDHMKGIDPRKGQPARHGTPNRRSYTYKMRKAAGYSYP